MNVSNPSPPQSAGLSHEIADAARELACRIDLGEFDDLDDTQMSELHTLATLMNQWAKHAQAMENRLNQVSDGSDGHKVAYCN